MDPFRLDGRKAVITGGTQGVGGAIARAIARAGGDVLLIGLQQDELADETLRDCRAFGVAAELILMDLASPARMWIDSLMSRIDEVMPGVDMLVNNAGTYNEPNFLEVDSSTYEKTMNLNVGAGFFLTQALSRRWVETSVDGRVVFTGSINGILSEPDHTVYDTSKGAVASMVRSLCVALAPHEIRVNSMAPGLVKTPLTQSAIESDGLGDWMRLHTPNGCVPDASVCGETVVFLLSQAAKHIHGQTIFVDGGMSVWQQPEPPR